MRDQNMAVNAEKSTIDNFHVKFNVLEGIKNIAIRIGKYASFESAINIPKNKSKNLNCDETLGLLICLKMIAQNKKEVAMVIASADKELPMKIFIGMSEK